MYSDSYGDKTMYKIEDFLAFQQTSENLIPLHSPIQKANLTWD